MNRLQRLHDAGVSIWLDTLSRELLETGKFAQLIRDYGVTGATSNPTIFAKAITGSDRYDSQLRRLAGGGEHDLQQLFFALALDDIRDAARELRPAYEQSGRRDGFVSFECTPDLADDPAAAPPPTEHMSHPLTMLAYDMNDQPLPFGRGAPLRLRNEIELGFKQVKWIKGIEFVARYSEIGSGYGGYNQDHEFFGYRQSI